MTGKICRGIDYSPINHQAQKAWGALGLNSQKNIYGNSDITCNISFNPRLVFSLLFVSPTLVLIANSVWVLFFLFSFCICLHLFSSLYLS